MGCNGFSSAFGFTHGVLNSPSQASIASTEITSILHLHSLTAFASSFFLSDGHLLFLPSWLRLRHTTRMTMGVAWHGIDWLFFSFLFTLHHGLLVDTLT